MAVFSHSTGRGCGGGGGGSGGRGAAAASQRLVEAAQRGDARAAAECLADPAVDVNHVGAVCLRGRRVEVALREEAADEVRVEWEELRTDASALFLAAQAGDLPFVRTLLVRSPLPYFEFLFLFGDQRFLLVYQTEIYFLFIYFSLTRVCCLLFFSIIIALISAFIRSLIYLEIGSNSGWVSNSSLIRNYTSLVHNGRVIGFGSDLSYTQSVYSSFDLEDKPHFPHKKSISFCSVIPNFPMPHRRPL